MSGRPEKAYWVKGANAGACSTGQRDVEHPPFLPPPYLKAAELTIVQTANKPPRSRQCTTTFAPPSLGRAFGAHPQLGS